ncbi:MAG: alpha/beta hydrolase, partial [Lachnospiraceae bacterium]|nr:alpha/beta hydrolase [Lachnospiraceae bacterium]
AEKTYSSKHLKQAEFLYDLFGNITKPKSLERFIIEASSCLGQDTYDYLDKILCPTLVVGGEQDMIVTGEASVEMAERIPDCKLKMYKELGHGLYEETSEYVRDVIGFFTGETAP